MTIVEFEDLLDRLGEDLSRWPPAQQAAARQLLAESEVARRLLQEAVALRQLMTTPVAPASQGLRDAIFARTIENGQSGTRSGTPDGPASGVLPAWMVPSSRVVRLAFLSICFVVGLACGVLHNMQALDLNEVDFHDFMATVLDVRYAKD
ncbi:MAG: hypothetical protein OJF62_000910 [Pseudolabrys sp.]|jgi:hypothetical protein|nr:hypothetical protein [Pseudolabrys sp.]